MKDVCLTCTPVIKIKLQDNIFHVFAANSFTGKTFERICECYSFQNIEKKDRALE
jgi:hypothetical protein